MAKTKDPLEKSKIEEEMRMNPELIWILQDISLKEIENENKLEILSNQILNFDDLIFSQGSHLMSNKSCQLPTKSYRSQKNGYEEIHIPFPQPPKIEPNEVNSIRISDFFISHFCFVLDFIFNIELT